MRARDSRLADRLMFVVSVTTNLSQRIAGRLVQLPAPVTFILSQLGRRLHSEKGLDMDEAKGQDWHYAYACACEDEEFGRRCPATPEPAAGTCSRAGNRWVPLTWPRPALRSLQMSWFARDRERERFYLLPGMEIGRASCRERV